MSIEKIKQHIHCKYVYDFSWQLIFWSIYYILKSFFIVNVQKITLNNPDEKNMIKYNKNSKYLLYIYTFFKKLYKKSF